MEIPHVWEKSGVSSNVILYWKKGDWKDKISAVLLKDNICGYINLPIGYPGKIKSQHY